MYTHTHIKPPVLRKGHFLVSVPPWFSIVGIATRGDGGDVRRGRRYTGLRRARQLGIVNGRLLVAALSIVRYELKREKEGRKEGQEEERGRAEQSRLKLKISYLLFLAASLSYCGRTTGKRNTSKGREEWNGTTERTRKTDAGLRMVYIYS